MGGSYQGGNGWNKPANDIDKCFKIYYMHEGEAVVSSEKTKLTLCAENLYFINGHMLTSQYCPEFMSVDWIHFIPDSVYINHLLKTCSLVIPLDVQSFLSFMPLFGKLSSYFNDPCLIENERAVTMEVQALVQFTIAQVISQIDSDDFEASVGFIRLLPALELINTHYKTNISLKILAETCCLSSNYFHRIFRKNFGITPFDYILKVRMEEALRLLAYTEKSIKEIAYIIGYDDEAYFSRMFSKNYSESPGRYRKNNQSRLP
jgi:AraC-like DNA-binding protein